MPNGLDLDSAPLDPDVASAMAALQAAQAKAKLGVAPDPDAARANKYMSGAIYSALLDSCQCKSCRALRQVARLTVKFTDQELDL